MYIYLKNAFVRRFFSVLIIMAFSFTLIMPPTPVFAQNVLITAQNLPSVGTMIKPSMAYNPVMLKGVNISPDNPFKFSFIIDKGDKKLDADELRDESTKLIKYFLAALTSPEDEMWVNLSPYEKNRIIPEGFGRTQMGRDLLAQDYLLKQLTASLMYPEDDLGDRFWSSVREKAIQKYGTLNIPTNTFNKVWIVPKKAEVYEHAKGAYVVSSYLNVMLEEDYLALESNQNSTKHGLGNVSKNELEKIGEVAEEVIRDLIIPEIEKEVNEGQTFANLRQIYHSMILSMWYKRRFKDSVLGKVYVDLNKTTGIDFEDKDANKKIYEKYVAAFKEGVFDYIKEEYDESTQEIYQQKYFSGGAVAPKDLAMVSREDLTYSDNVTQVDVELIAAETSDNKELEEAQKALYDRIVDASHYPTYLIDYDNLRFLASTDFLGVDTIRQAVDQHGISFLYNNEYLSKKNIRKIEKRFKYLVNETNISAEQLRQSFVQLPDLFITIFSNVRLGLLESIASFFTETGGLDLNRFLEARGEKLKIKDIAYVSYIRALDGFTNITGIDPRNITLQLDEDLEEQDRQEIIALAQKYGDYEINFKETSYKSSDFDFLVTGVDALANLTMVSKYLSSAATGVDKVQLRKEMGIESDRPVIFIYEGWFFDKKIDIRYLLKDLKKAGIANPLIVMASRRSQDYLTFRDFTLRFQARSKKLLIRKSITDDLSEVGESDIVYLKTQGELSRFLKIANAAIWNHDANIFEPIIERIPTLVIQRDDFDLNDDNRIGNRIAERAGAVLLGDQREMLEQVKTVLTNPDILNEGMDRAVDVVENDLGAALKTLLPIQVMSNILGADLKDEGLLAEDIGEVQRKVGGIDLNPNELDLQVNQEVEGLRYNVDNHQFQDFDPKGFIPVIINIAPITNLPFLLGEADTTPKGDTQDEPLLISSLDPAKREDLLDKGTPTEN